VRIPGILATFIAAVVLSVAQFSAACDLSCAFNQLISSCDRPTQLAGQMQMPMPIHTEGMDHAHYAQQSKLGQIELATIHASWSIGLCQHQPCAQPATLSLQKTGPMAPQFAHAVLTVVAHLQPDDTFVMMHQFDSGSFPRNPSALDPLSTSLRI
jgi:hypothetical protein